MPSLTKPSMPDAIRRIADSGDRQLAWQFFIFFSRFEYALKRSSKYLKPGAVANPNWERFSSDHDAAFQKLLSPELGAAIEYFRESPPRKQMQTGGQLSWSEPLAYRATEPLLVWLLRDVRVVRNNLFHGGKFPGLPILDASRDKHLISNAIVILDSCLSLDQSVRRQFLGGLNE
jgi:hypothetical protein